MFCVRDRAQLRGGSGIGRNRPFPFFAIFLKPGTPADKMQAVVLQYTKEAFTMSATGFLMKYRNRHIMYELF